MNRLPKHLLYTIVIFINFSCQIRDTGIDLLSQQKPADFLSVTRVVDGDTFYADNGTEKGLKVRLIGIDAPEARRVFNKEVGYYGPEAKAYLTELLANKKVRLVSDVDPLDRFGRTLSYVYLEDGTFVNAELIKNGYAVLMTIPPNVAFADHFSTLQREARASKKGLWNDQSPDNIPVVNID